MITKEAFGYKFMGIKRLWCSTTDSGISW